MTGLAGVAAPVLAKVLTEHYRQAVFPPDAKSNPYVYWLAGPNLHPEHSYVFSHAEFNQRYLSEFGPLFDVAVWIKQYRDNPDKAVKDIEERARKMRERDQQDRDNQDQSQQGRRSDLVDDTSGNINEVERRPTGTSVEAALRRLRKARPDLHARVLAGELSAHAAMIEAGFRKPRPRDSMPGLTKLRRAWKHASAEERTTFRAEIAS
jgi:hypothetical protein